MKKYRYHMGPKLTFEFIELKGYKYDTSVYEANIPEDLVNQYEEALSELNALEEAIKDYIVKDND